MFTILLVSNDQELIGNINNLSKALCFKLYVLNDFETVRYRYNMYAYHLFLVDSKIGLYESSVLLREFRRFKKVHKNGCIGLARSSDEELSMLRFGFDDAIDLNKGIEVVYYKLSRLIDLTSRLRGMFIFFPSNYEKQSKQERRYKRILDAFNNNYSDKTFNLVKFSKHLNISEAYAKRLFHETVRQSFSSFLKSFRLEQARKLVLTTVKTIDEISRLTGFGTKNTFIVNYRKYYLENPKDTRDKLNRDHRKRINL